MAAAVARPRFIVRRQVARTTPAKRDKLKLYSRLAAPKVFQVGFFASHLNVFLLHLGTFAFILHVPCQSSMGRPRDLPSSSDVCIHHAYVTAAEGLHTIYRYCAVHIQLADHAEHRIHPSSRRNLRMRDPHRFRGSARLYTKERYKKEAPM